MSPRNWGDEEVRAPLSPEPVSSRLQICTFATLYGFLMGWLACLWAM